MSASQDSPRRPPQRRRTQSIGPFFPLELPGFDTPITMSPKPVEEPTFEANPLLPPLPPPLETLDFRYHINRHRGYSAGLYEVASIHVPTFEPLPETGYASVFPFHLSSYSTEDTTSGIMEDPQAFLTYVVDKDSLIQAVTANPQRIFDAVITMGSEREDLRKQRDRLLIERDGFFSLRDKIFRERDELLAERGGLLTKRDELLMERDRPLIERDSLRMERNELLAERNRLLVQLDGVRGDLHEVRSQLASMTQNYQSSKIDYETQATSYEQKLQMKNQQQLVFLRSIERLRLVIAKGGLDPDSCNHIPSKIIPPPELGLDLGEDIDDAQSATSSQSQMGNQTKLDPSAQTFTPTHGNSLLVSEPVPWPTSPSAVPEYMLQRIISSLPTHLQGICPISLSSDTPCSITGCQLVKLCSAYNDETSSTGCSTIGCTLAHEYRTCEIELDGKGGVCGYFEAYNGSRNGTGSNKGESKKRLNHVHKRVHQGNCDEEEWKGREISAGLRSVHLEGRWLH